MFQTHENLEHLAMMERVLGPLPQHILKRAECVLFHIPFSDCKRESSVFFLTNFSFDGIIWLVDMLRSMLKGEDWTGQKGRHLGTALELF